MAFLTFNKMIHAAENLALIQLNTHSKIKHCADFTNRLQYAEACSRGQEQNPEPDQVFQLNRRKLLLMEI